MRKPGGAGWSFLFSHKSFSLLRSDQGKEAKRPAGPCSAISMMAIYLRSVRYLEGERERPPILYSGVLRQANTTVKIT